MIAGTPSMERLPLAKALSKTKPSFINESKNGVWLCLFPREVYSFEKLSSMITHTLNGAVAVFVFCFIGLNFFTSSSSEKYFFSSNTTSFGHSAFSITDLSILALIVFISKLSFFALG
jgi:hypothetical protein